MTELASPASQISTSGKLLVVDDEKELANLYQRAFEAFGLEVHTAFDGLSAIKLLEQIQFDAILSDISMPGMDGIQLLRHVRTLDPDVPVVLLTGAPEIASAMEAVEHRAFRYLAKPVRLQELRDVIQRAIRLHRLARVKRETLRYLEEEERQSGDRARLEGVFQSAMRSLYMAYQPIIRWPERELYGHEALVRTEEPELVRPDNFIHAAEKLQRLPELGRLIRARVAADMPNAPALVFVNLHSVDLLDEQLYDSSTPFSKLAPRIVLEITERASLSVVNDAAARVASLKKMGFRVAVDDLGAGYAGLNSFTLLEPHMVKLDMVLVRDMHKSPVKAKLVQSIVQLCRELGIDALAEGVEVAEERDVLERIGCGLLQGYLFGKPGKPFPPALFDSR